MLSTVATNPSEHPSIPIIRITMVKEGENKYSKEQVTSPSIASTILSDFFKDLDREAMFVLCLSTSKNPVGIHLVSIGSINSTITAPREIFKPAILSNADSIILAHNHPSGNLEASRADLNLTNSISRLGDMMNIALNDHLIFSPDGEYISLKLLHPGEF